MEDIKNMPFNEEMSEMVDRFLRKEMSDTESKAFAEEVETNPELREYYQCQFSLMRGVKIHEMREVMRAKEENWPPIGARLRFVSRTSLPGTDM